MSPDDELTILLRQWIEAVTVRSMHEWSSWVRSTGLSMPQFGALMFLHHCGTCSVNDVGERMEVTGAAASQMLERLVQAGLVARSESPEDRRVRLVALTDKGRALVLSGIEQRHRWLDQFVALLPEDRRQAVLAALPLLINAETRLSASERPDSAHL